MTSGREEEQKYEELQFESLSARVRDWRVQTTPAIHSTSPRLGLEHAQRKASFFQTDPPFEDALQGYLTTGEFSLLKVATNVPRAACSMARRESATRSRWRTERGRLATAATAPHGLHPLSRLWPSNSLPARRAHSNAPAAPADCQCLLSRAHVSREDSAASPPQQRLPRMAAASNAAARCRQRALSAAPLPTEGRHRRAAELGRNATVVTRQN